MKGPDVFRACNQALLASERDNVHAVTSLRRIEAAARSAQIRPVSYSVRLELDDDPAGFASATRIEFTAQPGAAGFVDVRPRAAERGACSTASRSTSRADFADGRLQLGELRESNELVVDAVMAYSHDGEGLVRHVDPADGRTYLYAMSFLDAAPRWFACFDQPDLKAPVTLEVDVPARLDGRRQRPGRAVGAGAVDGQPAPSRRDLHDDAGRRAVPLGARRRTTASRSCCTRARRSPSSSTAMPPRCSSTPGAASTSSTGCSACATRGASTTRRSSPTSTPARWRTRAASPSATR